jgi:hypothetical protein
VYTYPNAGVLDRLLPPRGKVAPQQGRWPDAGNAESAGSHADGCGEADGLPGLSQWIEEDTQLDRDILSATIRWVDVRSDDGEVALELGLSNHGAMPHEFTLDVAVRAADEQDEATRVTKSVYLDTGTVVGKDLSARRNEVVARNVWRSTTSGAALQLSLVPSHTTESVTVAVPPGTGDVVDGDVETLWESNRQAGYVSGTTFHRDRYWAMLVNPDEGTSTLKQLEHNQLNR